MTGTEMRTGTEGLPDEAGIYERIKAFMESKQDEVLELYLTLDYGRRILLYEDYIGVGEPNSRPNTEQEYISLSVPGVGNIDRVYYIDGWAERTTTGKYVETETGREIGGWEDVVTELVRDGDMTSLWESIRDEVEEQIELQEEMEGYRRESE